MEDTRDSSLRRFEKLLHDHLIPEFCADRGRGCDPTSFRAASQKIGEEDATYFLMAWDAGLIEHQGRGMYRAPNSAAKEQFFWEHEKLPEMRPFSLWLEPIITVGGLARLHFDHGWPKEWIGSQSRDWAFDLVTTLPGSTNEVIAGEVKKTTGEVVKLIALMKSFGADPSATIPQAGAARNAFKKVMALRARGAPIFWALGPDGTSEVFVVAYRPGGVVEFIPAVEGALTFRTSDR